VPFPSISFADISLLFAVGSIVLLIIAELSSACYGQTNLTIDRKKLKNASYFTGIAFLITAIIKIITIL
jgi:hypothetical protein